jgi:hypothetical protein
MNRRKFLIGAGSLAAGSAAAMGTGAFTSVEANRTVTVSTAEDSDALLRMEATSDNANSEYATTQNGEISIDLGGLTGNEQGSGVNQNATTRVFDIFTIQNQGTQPAIVYAQPSSLKEDDAFDDSVDNVYVDPQFSDMPNDGDSSLGTLSDGETKFGSLSGIGGSVEDFETDLFENNSEVPYSPNTFLLGVGQSFDFGLYVKTTGEVNNVDIDIDIEADAALAERI